jgi:subtilisin family serine protease
VKKRARPAPSETTSGVQKRDTKLTPQRGETVAFEVLCRPQSGAQQLEMASELSVGTVERYSPDERTVAEVARSLQQAGFRVFVEDKCTSVSAAGPYDLFEKVFRTTLRKRGRTLKAGGREHAFEFFDTEESAPQPSVKDIAGALDVAIQRPPIFLESPLPPPVRYFHLAVPGDVAMLTRASATHRRSTPSGARATGAGVRVAMLDTGFFVHPYYHAHDYRLFPTSAADAPGLATDDASGHGTGEVANIFACAPDARVAGVKMGANPVLAFDRAMALAPRVISCSWGFHLPGVTSLPVPLIPLRLRVLSAVAAGVTVVFSGGNGHVAFPAMMPEVIAVGGVYADNAGKLRASDYASSFMSLIFPGRRVPDFCGLVGLAPGAHYIMLPIPRGCAIDTTLAGLPFPNKDETAASDGWGVFSGTSAAAPQVAGICALLIQKDSTLTPAHVKASLRSTAQDVTVGTSSMGESAGPGVDPATGAGLVDALRAWLSV